MTALNIHDVFNNKMKSFTLKSIQLKKFILHSATEKQFDLTQIILEKH